jgi:hypothetical protein
VLVRKGKKRGGNEETVAARLLALLGERYMAEVLAKIEVVKIRSSPV